jgi:anti-sigma factor RsiW
MSVSDEELQRYFDGELDDATRRRVEGALDDDDRARLDALAEVRAALSNALLGEAAAIDLTGAVGEAIARDAERAAPVIPLAARRPRRRGMVMGLSTGAGLLVAAAAAFLFLFRPVAVPGAPINNAEIESLEVDGLSATVLSVDSHSGTENATILFAMEDD